jgi:uncharacterized protein YjiS (DUF1127 family)
MLTLTLDRFAPARIGAERVLNLVAMFIDGVREGREMATRYERLRRLSDHDLARLGLTRADIPRAAVNGVAGL